MSTEAIKKSGKAYLFEIHFLRALACLGVLAVHVSATYYGMNGEKFDAFSHFLNQVGRFGTPIFAVISGFLLFLQVRNKGFQFGKYIKSRFAKVIIPFILWSVAYRYMMYLYTGKGIADPATEIITFLEGESFYHLYFISIVLQFYLIFPLLAKLFNSQSLIIVFAFVSLIISYNLYGIQPPFDGALGEFIASKAFMPVWIFYFAFGGLMAYYWEGIRDFAVKRPITMLLVTIAVTIGCVIEYKTVGYVSNRRLTNLVNIPLLCVSIVGMYPLLSKFAAVRQPLVLLGKYSMGIYLIHPMILYLLARHLPEQYWSFAYVAPMFIVVTVLCAAAIRLITFLPLSTYLLPVPKIKKSGSGKHSKAQDGVKQPA
ncbi:acyltransferase [Metabacillus sp. 84]|uniref:acyltransferase n=1 Tax=unclassified Metabacillus TaxID=2675274 RepID=UPI003CE8AC04